MPVHRPSGLLLEELESRILFSADTALLANFVSLDGAAVTGPQQYQMTPVVLPAATASSSAGGAAGVDAALVAAATDEKTGSPAIRQEIVFIDGAVDGAPSMATQLRARQEDGRSLEVVVLDTDADGVSQIGLVLASRHDIDAVHIISHGSDGELRLGSTQLNLASLPASVIRISHWGEALATRADILLYGCDVAFSSSGQRFVDTLALLTGADMAASSNVTGSAALLADWTLEYASGQIESQGVADAALRQNFNGILGGEAGAAAGPAVQTPAFSASAVGLVAPAAVSGAGNAIAEKGSTSVVGSSGEVRIQMSEFRPATAARDNVAETRTLSSRQSAQAALVAGGQNETPASGSSVVIVEPSSVAQGAYSSVQTAGSLSAGRTGTISGQDGADVISATLTGSGARLAEGKPEPLVTLLPTGAEIARGPVAAHWKLALIQHGSLARPGDGIPGWGQSRPLSNDGDEDGQCNSNTLAYAADGAHDDDGSGASTVTAQQAVLASGLASGLTAAAPVWEMARKALLLGSVIHALPGWLRPAVRAKSAAQRARELGMDQAGLEDPAVAVERMFDSSEP